LHPHASGGVYVNFLTDDEAARIPSAYGEELHERLAVLKAKHDPDNLFRVNQNIAPAT
jgi:plasmid maintenance system killer protein